MPDEKVKTGAAGEDSYSAKTHLHQPVVAPETATVAATALPANAPEGALPSEVRPEIVTYEKLVEAIKASGKAYNMEMIDKAYNMANDAHKGVCRRSGEPYICHPLAVARTWWRIPPPPSSRSNPRSARKWPCWWTASPS